MENVLFRVENTSLPDSVKTVVIAVGTSNLMSDSVDKIVRYLKNCVTVIASSRSDVKTFVQSILPRNRVRTKITNMIEAVNSRLEATFGDAYLDAYSAFVDLENQVIKSMFYRSGRHLNKAGLSTLVKVYVDRLCKKNKVNLSDDMVQTDLCLSNMSNMSGKQQVKVHALTNRKTLTDTKDTVAGIMRGEERILEKGNLFSGNLSSGAKKGNFNCQVHNLTGHPTEIGFK